MTRVLPAIALTLLAGCSTRISVDDVPGRPVALGPLLLDGDAVVVELAVWDHEGDAVDLELRWGTGGSADTVATALSPYSLRGLPTDPGLETRHVVVWRFADDGVPVDAPIAVSLVSVDGLSPAVTLTGVQLSALAPGLPATAAP